MVMKVLVKSDSDGGMVGIWKKRDSDSECLFIKSDAGDESFF